MASDSDSYSDSESRSDSASHSDSDSKDSTESLSQSRCNVEDANGLVECTLLKGKPCQACERHSKLHNQIEATKKLLEKLILEDNEALMDINRCHDPVHRLPPEIIAHIFGFIVATDFVPQELDNYAADGLEFRSELGALTLGAVCRTWRTIAWSTPRLWSTVILSVPWEPTWNKIVVVREWLERSRPLPLTIRLDMNDYYEDHEREDTGLADNLAYTFNDYSDRWEILSVQTPAWISELFTGNEKRDCAPLLKMLHLVLKDYPSDGARFPLRGAILPQLSHIIAIGYYRQLEYVTISWSNVTNAVVDTLELENCVQLLHVAPMLVNLRLRHVENSSTTTVNTPNLVLHHLRTLEFTPGDRNVTYSTILDSVTLPLLEDLSIKGCYDFVPFPFNSLKKLFDCSFCPLINLRLDNFKCEQQAILDLLYVLPPSVKYIQLDVSQTSYTDHWLPLLFDHLSRNPAAQHGMPSGSALLPNLEEFKYYVFKDTEIPWDRLPNLLYPLSGLPRPFKNLSFIERDRHENSPQLFAKGEQIGKDAMRALMKLKDGGVDLFLPSEVSFEDVLKLLEE